MRPETIPLFDPRFRKGDGAEWISKTSKTLAAFFYVIDRPPKSQMRWKEY